MIYISYSFSTFDFVLHPGERVIIRGDIGDDGFLIRSCCIYILGVQQSWYAQFRISHIKCVIQVINVFVLLQFRPGDQLRPVSVNKRIKAEPAPPRCCNNQQFRHHYQSTIYHNHFFPSYNSLKQIFSLVKSCILTPGYPFVFLWHHSSSASLADFFSLLSFSSSTSISISWIWKRKIIVQIRPNIRRGLPSTMSSAPILSRRTWNKQFDQSLFAATETLLKHYFFLPFSCFFFLSFYFVNQECKNWHSRKSLIISLGDNVEICINQVFFVDRILKTSFLD